MVLAVRAPLITAKFGPPRVWPGTPNCMWLGKVEELAAEFHLPALAGGDGLQRGQVDVVETRRALRRAPPLSPGSPARSGRGPPAEKASFTTPIFAPGNAAPPGPVIRPVSVLLTACAYSTHDASASHPARNLSP